MERSRRLEQYDARQMRGLDREKETMMKVQADDPPVPWHLATPHSATHGLHDRSSVGAVVEELLRPYVFVAHTAINRADDATRMVVPAWAVVLASTLWYDTDETQGLGRPTISRALSWAKVQPDPVRAAQALCTVHLSNGRDTHGAQRGQHAVNAYLDMQPVLGPEPVPEEDPGEQDEAMLGSEYGRTVRVDRLDLSQSTHARTDPSTGQRYYVQVWDAGGAVPRRLRR